MLRLFGLTGLTGLSRRLGVYSANPASIFALAADDDQALYADDMDYLEVYA